MDRDRLSPGLQELLSTLREQREIRQQMERSTLVEIWSLPETTDCPPEELL